VRIRTLCIAACALPFAANVSCGSDSPASACKDVPVSTAKPTLAAATTQACGSLNDCTAQPVGSCRKPFVPSSGVTTIDLGTQTVGTVVSFNVPAGTASISIVEQANGSGPTAPPDTVTLNRTTNSPGTTVDNAAVPDQLRNPSNTLLYDDNAPLPPADPSGETVFFQSPAPFTGTFTVPNTSKLLAQAANGLPTGQWSFVVNDFGYECSRPNISNCCIPPVLSTDPTCKQGGSATTYDVKVLLKGGAPRTSGTVDVAYYLADIVTPATPPNTKLKAADAPTDPTIIRMVSTLSSIYAKVGIRVGKVTFYDLPQWAVDRFGALDIDSIGPCDDLDQMFTLSVPGNQLNFFLVGSFVTKAQGQVHVAGIDGTIPGPSAFGGTIHSGAVVNGADLAGSAAGCAGAFTLSCNADEVAYIAAHEGGHWMGLYHVTEQLGDFFDPLVDTAKCPCETCVPAAARSQCSNFDPNVPPVVNGVNCTKSASCGGGDNLMFWLLDDASTGALSCEQGAVMRVNPVVQ